MSSWSDVPVLEGSLVRLEPLSARHAAGLAAAAEEDRDSYAFTLVPRADEVTGYLEAQSARKAAGLVPFAQVRQADGQAVGCTAYWEPRFWPGRRLPTMILVWALRTTLPWFPARSQPGIRAACYGRYARRAESAG